MIAFPHDVERFFVDLNIEFAGCVCSSIPGNLKAFRKVTLLMLVLVFMENPRKAAPEVTG